MSTGLLVFTGNESPFRAVMAFWFLLICPGMALVRFLRIGEPFAEVSIAIALSMAIDTIVAGTMLYAGAWSTSISLLVLIYISVGGAVIQLASHYRQAAITRRQKLIEQ
jgi:uncharacterized membrane protein